MKLTIVIADDEPIVLKSEELFLQKEFPELEIVGRAENGIQLKQQLESLEPDMAMIDIHMPGLTGLEVMELLKHKHSRTHFIINTAYSDFEYVKKALDLKTDGYLLKPSKKEEKLEVIGRLKRLIETEKQQEQRRAGIDMAIDRVNSVLGSEILMSVFSEQLDTEGFEAYCQINGIDFAGGCIATFLPQLQNDISRQEIQGILEQGLGGVCCFLSTVTVSGIVVMYIIPEELQELTDLQQAEWCRQLSETMAMRLEERLGGPCLFGSGHIYGQFEQMHASYLDSTAMLRAGIGSRQETAQLRIKKDGGERSAAQRFGWPASMADDEEEALAESQLQTDEQSSGSSIDTSEDGTDKTGSYTERSKEYIERFYQRDISLQDCADNVGISPYYLSHIFKEQTGQTFIEYLSEVRISEAKRLSLETRLTISEIAQQCGYSNITYFCKVFKRQTGKTIGEYRRTERK